MNLRSWCAAGLVGALMKVCAAGPAWAEVRIQHDLGGQIGDYLKKYAAVRHSGERVVVDGRCASACTLALGVIPHDRICVTDNAVLAFHAAWEPLEDGRTVTHRAGTALLMSIYPPTIRAWIKHHGGLSRDTILLQGRELAALYPRCP